MTPRSIRRAAERKAAKLARKAERVAHFPIPEPSAPSRDCEGAVPRAISPAQLTANRQNAQFSTGPRSEAGKAISSHNNFKHGFRSEFCVLPTEDQQEFDNLLAAFREEHQPSTPSEETLVEQLAKHLWLSRRAARLLDQAFMSNDDVRERQKSIALYLRYQVSNDRGFSKSLNDLLRIRAQKFREQLGFERQKHKEAMDAERLKQKRAAEVRKQELHEARVRTANARAANLEQKTTAKFQDNPQLQVICHQAA